MRAGIKIRWGREVVIKSLKIKHPLAELPAAARPLNLQSSRWQGHAAQPLLDALDQMVLARKQKPGSARFS